MTRHYCDICGKEVDPDEIHGRTFKVTYKGIRVVKSVFCVDDRDWLMCDDCYKDMENYISSRIDEFQEKKEISNET